MGNALEPRVLEPWETPQLSTAQEQRQSLQQSGLGRLVHVVLSDTATRSEEPDCVTFRAGLPNIRMGREFEGRCINLTDQGARFADAHIVAPANEDGAPRCFIVEYDAIHLSYAK